MSLDKLTNDFCRWFNQYENGKSKIKILSRTLKHISEDVLPSRDEERLFMVRSFTNSKDLKINLIHKNLWCKPDEEKGLLVGTLAPNWNSGWKKICKDEFVSQQIDFFFHFVTQYIYRSFQINLIGSLALTYGRYCDFRGSYMTQCKLPFFKKEFERFQHSIKPDLNNRTNKIKHYLNIINALDPYVNKTIYYYVNIINNLSFQNI